VQKRFWRSFSLGFPFGRRAGSLLFTRSLPGRIP
jgi:hypothetical protein